MPYNWTAPIEVRDRRNGDWFWVHKHVWADDRLTSSDKVIYGSLAYFANNKTQNLFPSLSKLATNSNVSRSQVAISIKRLEELKYIKIKRTKGKANRYTLLKTRPVQKLDQSKKRGRVVQKKDRGSPKEGHEQELITRINNKKGKKVLRKTIKDLGLRRTLTN